MEKSGIWIAIAVGGALGALARFFLTEFIQSRVAAAFPWGTWAVNLIGCFLIGVFFALGMETTVLPPAMKAFVITGFLGAFTTFSTFSNESLGLFREGLAGIGLLYMLSSNILGILLTAAGTWVVHWWLRT